MAPTPEQTKAGYRAMWERAVVKDNKRADATALAKKILAHRASYEAVEAKTGVPWFMVGVIHMREASLNFNSVLHNGEKIVGTGRKTKLVPAGRGPFATWEQAAIDALSMPPHALNRIDVWTVERMLYEIEKYNGWGYLGKCNSPYLWSWTSEYGGGKYVADHVFSKTAVDAQPGCVALLKALAALDNGVSVRLTSATKPARPAVPVQPATPPAKTVPAPKQPETPKRIPEAPSASQSHWLVGLLKAIFGRK